MPPKTAKTPVNRLFVEWLDSWMSLEQERNSQQMYWVLRKASTNLALETQPLTPQQLIRVKGIGANICTRIERKLKQFLDDGGQMNDVYLDGVLPADEEVAAPAVSKKKKKDSAVSATSDGDDQPSTSTGGGAAKKARAYNPRYRSGAYAILMAMYTHTISNGQDAVLSRTQIEKDAQSYCDSSFTQGSSANTVSYTAWTSMAALIKKDLVFKRGSPAKYCLTIHGNELAARLWAQTEEFEAGNGNDPNPQSSTVSSSFIASTAVLQVQSSVSTANDEIPWSPDPPVSAASTSTGSSAAVFLFQYVDGDGGHVNAKEKAAVQCIESSNDFMELCFKIVYHSALASHSFCAKVHKDGPASGNQGYLFGFLSDEHAPEVAPGLTAADPVRHIGRAKNLDDRSRVLATPKAILGDHIPKSTSVTTAKKASTVTSSVSREPPKLPSTAAKQKPTLKSSSSSGSKRSNQNSSSLSADKPKESFSPWPTYPEAEYELKWNGEPVCFPPNTFDIIIVIDTREQKSGSDRQYIQQNLERRNVLYSTRVLQVGDIGWIARSKIPSPNGQYREIVLDFIVERKRLDDLVSSIKSGRFKEQKIRLSHSSINRVFYLIEDMVGSGPVESFGQPALRSAYSLIQVLDDIQVLRAKNFDDCIEMLMRLHHTVIDTYKGKPLFAVPEAVVEKQSYLQMKKALEKRDNRQYLLLYGSFNEINSKSMTLNIREIWLKQLLCIRGLTADKATRIVDRYPTPRSLMVALEREPFIEGKLRLFKNWDPIVTKNNIGAGLAKKIVDFFFGDQYCDDGDENVAN